MGKPINEKSKCYRWHFRISYTNAKCAPKIWAAAALAEIPLPSLDSTKAAQTKEEFKETVKDALMLLLKWKLTEWCHTAAFKPELTWKMDKETDMPVLTSTGQKIPNPHIQGCMYLKVPKLKTTILNDHVMTLCHYMQPQTHSQQVNSNYAVKTDTTDGEPVVLGDPATDLTTDEKDEFKEDETPSKESRFIKAVRNGDSDERLLTLHPTYYLKLHTKIITIREKERIAWLNRTGWGLMQVRIHWGPTSTGKTSHLEKEFGEDGFYKLTRPRGDVLWFDGFDPLRHKALLIDEFTGWLPLDMLLALTDQKSCIVPYKGGMVRMTARIIIFTSNRPWHTWYKEFRNAMLLPENERVGPEHEKYNGFRRRLTADLEFEHDPTKAGPERQGAKPMKASYYYRTRDYDLSF